MKIVQSYWSKPSSKLTNLHGNDRNLGGWLEKKYNYMSWMLSSLQLTKFYRNVELVTDEQGYEVLINKLNLPYSSVNVTLNRLDNYHSDLWALGKIYTYSIQEEPFIHVDGDVFIWDNFTTQIENSNLCVQNYEIDEPGYEEVYRYVKGYFEHVPNVLTRKGTQPLTSINAGIIGGNKISFFKEYTSIVFDFVNQNAGKVPSYGLNMGAFNMFYEQYLFHCLTVERKEKVTYLIGDQRELLDKYVNFIGVPSNTNYIHTVGTFKKRRETGKLLEHTLRSIYPQQYYRLIKLLKKHSI